MRTPSVVAAVTGTSVVVLVAALVAGGAVDDTVIPGIPSAGAGTAWALPVLTLLANVCGVVTVGLVVTAAFLLPGDGRSVAAYGWVLLRRSTWPALGWAVSCLALIVVTVSDVLGVPVGELSRPSVLSFAFSISQGQALLAQAGLAGLVAVLTRSGVSRGVAAVTAGVALVALVPPALTGHSAGAGDHQLAVTSLALHIVAASLWVGGLAGLLLVRRHRRFPDTALRYSRLALACFVVTAVSGAANAAVRLGTWEALGSAYGMLVLLKVSALLVAGVLGAAHRGRTLPALRAGAPGAFLRLAAGELLVLGAAVGLAVGLSRSPTPVPEIAVAPEPIVELLGFEPPGPFSVAGLTGDLLPDMFFLTVVAAGLFAYLAGVRRLRAQGTPWPVRRTASWLAAMALLAAATCLGVAKYAYVLFSVHMVQHVILALAVPLLLVGGAPVTLALRALRRPADPEVRGAREWLVLILHSGLLRFLTHPVVALVVYVAGLSALYLGGLLGTIMRYHLGHLGMLAYFVGAGSLLAGALLGTGVRGRRGRHPAVAVGVQLLSAAAYAILGLVLLRSATIAGADWYLAVHPDWAVSLAADQRRAAVLTWVAGAVPAAVLLALLIRRWVRGAGSSGTAGEGGRDGDSGTAGTSAISGATNELHTPHEERTSCDTPSPGGAASRPSPSPAP